ncbi:hypothetical protein TI03_06990, partial [Achromatium sp. WMS1]
MGMLLLITTILALILTYFSRLTCRSFLHSPSWLPIAALWAYLVPALFFLAWVNWVPPDASRFRLALRGLGFGATPQTQSFTIGGNPKQHDVWIPQLPKRHVVTQTRSRTRKGDDAQSTAVGTFKLTPGTITQPGHLNIEHPNFVKVGDKYWPPPALLLTKAGGRYYSPFAITLQNGDRLVYDSVEWLVDIQQRWFGLCPPDGSLQNKITLDDPVIVPRRNFCGTFPFNQHTYPLNLILDV